MAVFTIREVEGMRQVRLDIEDETVRAYRGALSNMRGDISLTPRIPSFGDVFRAFFTREAHIRPYYTGTGSIMLQPSLGGYHVLDVVKGDHWILEPGVYCASEGSLELGLHREKMFASLWAGDGFFSWKTAIEGHGEVAINAPGPVETVDVDDEDLKVQGRLVLGRTSGLKFSSRRSARFPRNLIPARNVYGCFPVQARCWCAGHPTGTSTCTCA